MLYTGKKTRKIATKRQACSRPRPLSQRTKIHTCSTTAPPTIPQSRPSHLPTSLRDQDAFKPTHEHILPCRVLEHLISLFIATFSIINVLFRKLQRQQISPIRGTLLGEANEMPFTLIVG
jgi:hypothetical protein